MTHIATTVLLVCFAQVPDRPADALLELLPSRPAGVLTIERLRDESARVTAWPFWKALQDVPAYQTWRDSDEARRIDRARAEIEMLFGASLQEIRDEILGDAVVLSLHLPAGEAGEPSGLVLIQPRNRDLLNRMVASVNTAERQAGAIAKIETIAWGGSSYQARRFQAAGRREEYFGWVTPHVFGWSNSELLLREALDRASASGGGRPEWLNRLRDALPTTAFARLYIDRVLIEQVRASAAAELGPSSDEVPRWARDVLDACQGVGLALDLSSGFELHVVEALEVDRFNPSLRRLLQTAGNNDGLLALVPAESMAVASGAFDWRAARDLLFDSLPETELPRLEQAEQMLSGLLLGHGLSDEILPAIGPGFLALALRHEGPLAEEHGSPWPATALVLEIANNAEVARALDNALRTVLAVTALDPKRPPGLRIETVHVRGSRVTRLGAGPGRIAFTVGPRLLVLGNSDELVAELAEGTPAPRTDEDLMALRTRHFPKAQHFLAADFGAIAEWLARNRDALAPRFAEKSAGDDAAAKADIDQAVDLLALFRSGFLAARIEDDGRLIHQTLGLIPKDQKSTRR